MPHIRNYKGKRAHMIGIGGSSMSGLAGMLQKAGVTVTGSDSAAVPIGCVRAVTVRMPRNSRNRGLRILPTQVRMPEGRREKYRTAAKNSAEKTHRARA